MLFARGRERQVRRASEELERITLGVNNGLVIARSEKARRDFERRRARRDHATAAMPSAAQQRAAAARLMSMFPGAVKVH